MDNELFLLFSKPIFRSEIKTNVDISDVEWDNNTFNQISKNRNILNEEKFKDLSIEINSKICEYFYGLMRASPEVEIYVTTSWLNKTEKGGSHHRHSHPNSILSGVVNLFGNINAGGNIHFQSGEHRMIDYDLQEYNVLNSNSWEFPFKTKTITIFPSSTEHFVNFYHGDEPRITLSFNSFVRGKICASDSRLSSNLII